MRFADIDGSGERHDSNSHTFLVFRYVVIKKLGWGHFSTVWMVKDKKAVSQKNEELYFALKVQKSAEHYTEAAMDEVELLDCIQKKRKAMTELAVNGGIDDDGVELSKIAEYSTHAATLHDSFFHSGPNGRHMCMVFTMLGCNLLSVIKAYNYRGIPIPVVKNMIKGICKGLDFLHRKCNIIHTDLKPENVLLQFEGQMESLTETMANMTMESSNDTGNTLGQSIVELERQLASEDLKPDERKKLKRKLKKKRQKERRKAESEADDSDGSDMDEDDSLSGAEEETNKFLSDFELSKMLLFSDTSGNTASVKLASNVKRRLPHSAFVTTNFGNRQESADLKLSELLRDSVDLERLSAKEMDANLQEAEVNGGVGEVTFLLRSFTPEEELVEGISSAFSDIEWDHTSEKTREW